MTSSLLFFTFGVLLSLGLMPLFIQLAQKSRFMDQPGHRKIHTSPVAKLGGVAITLAIVGAVGIGLLLSGESLALTFQRQFKIGLLLGFTVAAAFLGFLDDLYELRPRLKLFLQALLFGAFTVVGFRFEVLHLPGMETFELGLLAYPLTLFWLLAVVNGFNFMDGIDGLAGSVTTVCLLSIGAAGLFLNHFTQGGVIWPAALGAMLVFLAFNWKPAKIYLGDSGSSALGALVALSLVTLGAPLPGYLTSEGPSVPVEPFRFQLLVVTMFVAYPALEVTLSFLRRAVKRLSFGRSMEFSEKEHMHHQLLKAGFSTRSICLMAALFQTIVSVAGLLAMYNQNAFAAFLLVPLVMVLTYCLPRWEFFDYLGPRANLRKPHFRIANYYMSIQGIKVGLAHNREEVLALVSQTCWELGVKDYWFKIFPDASGMGGLDYHGRGEGLVGLNSPGLWGTAPGGQGPSEMSDIYELPSRKGQAYWVFDSHTSDAELDVEYRVLMNGFMRQALEACVALGSGRETLDVPSAQKLPHDRTSGHQLRKRTTPRPEPKKR